MSIKNLILLEAVGVTAYLILAFFENNLNSLNNANLLSFDFFMLIMFGVFVVLLPLIILLKLTDQVSFLKKKPREKEEPNTFIETLIPVHNPREKDIQTIIVSQIAMWALFLTSSYMLSDIYNDYGALPGFIAVSVFIFLVKIRVAYRYKRVNYKKLIKDTSLNIIIFVLVYFVVQFFASFIS